MSHETGVLQVIAEHKLWVQDKGLAGRIYLSTQGINAQYSGLTAHAEGYAMWLQQQEQFKVTAPYENTCIARALQLGISFCRPESSTLQCTVLETSVPH